MSGAGDCLWAAAASDEVEVANVRSALTFTFAQRIAYLGLFSP